MISDTSPTTHAFLFLISRPLKTYPNQTKTTHFANHPNQQNCFLSNTTKNLRYFTKNKPSFCQNKKIVAITSHFLKFQAQAAIKTLISSPTCPLSRFLESLKSDLRCPIIGSIAARLLHSLRFLSC
ncbi:hypothetical protein [uncultured Gammaproteobacteria bacterium]|nr:hypothetical protein [uncultured Gammaproteobacteria bacterium]